MDAVFGHVIPLKSEGFNIFDNHYILKAGFRYYHAFEITHQLFDAVSRHICSKVVISNRKSQHSSANFAIRANSLTITIYGNFAGTKFFLR